MGGGVRLVGIRILGSTDYYLIEGVYFNHEVGGEEGDKSHNNKDGLE